MPRNTSVSFEKLVQPLQKLMRWSIPALFFLVPLTFAPFTSEALEINKQLLMFVLVFLAAGGLLGVMVSQRQIKLRGGWLLNILPLVFLGVMLISTLASLGGMESWLGYGGQEYTSFLTAVLGVLLFYTLINGSDTSLARQSLLAVLLATSLLALTTGLSLLGVHLLPFAFTKTAGFNTIGNINSFIAWLIPVSLTGIGFYMVDSDDESSVIPAGPNGMVVRALIAFVTIMAVVLMASVDFWTLWTPFMIGLATLMALTFLEPSHFPNSRRLAVPAVLFLIAVVFLFIKTPIKLSVPVVVSPSVATSFDVAVKTLGEDPARLFFGSGPGTFDLDYAKFHPIEVNNTIFWNTRFDRAQAHPLTLLATTGILGFLSWLVFFGTVAAFGLGRIMRGRQETEWKVNYALLAGWLSLFVLQLLSPMNMSLIFLFWGFSGLLVAEAVSQVRQFDFSEAPRAAVGVTSGLALFTVMGVLTLFAMASRHSAEIAFVKAARMDAEGATPQQLVTQMEKVVARYPSNAVYQRNLATAYLAQAGTVVGEAMQDEDFGVDDRQKLAQVADAAIKASSKAANLAPHDGISWAVNGLIYRELMPFIQNAQNYAASMYVEALKYEPNNPAFQTDLGRVYLTVADRAQQVQDLDDIDEETRKTAEDNEAEDLRLAVENLETAIRLKPDYAPAHYYLAAAYERQGNLEEASKRLSALTQVQPNDVGLGFQLSIIYLKMERIDEAEKELERILSVYPDYSNAMWYLAAIKADKNDAAAALALLRRVDKLNPDNEAVQTSIANLEAGGTNVTLPDEPINNGNGGTPANP